MSVVTGIMLLASLGEDEHILVAINEWLSHRGDDRLVDVSNHGGGGKHPQFFAWSAGINYFAEVDEFAAVVMQLPWSFPQSVVLAMQPEEGCTKVYRPRQYAGIITDASRADAV